MYILVCLFSFSFCLFVGGESIFNRAQGLYFQGLAQGTNGLPGTEPGSAA